MDEIHRLYHELSALDSERKRIVQKIDALYHQERKNVERTQQIRRELMEIEKDEQHISRENRP